MDHSHPGGARPTPRPRQRLRDGSGGARPLAGAEPPSGDAIARAARSDARALVELRGLVAEKSGIQLGEEKDELMLARLGPLVRELEVETLTSLLELLERDASGRSLAAVIDAVTTNVTAFFREPRHFQHIEELASGAWSPNQHRGQVRIWSSACSTGEEPYSVAMSLERAVGFVGLSRYLVLASDLSQSVLRHGVRGTYGERQIVGIPAADRARWFHETRDPGRFAVDPRLSAQIRFRSLNLIGEWPMKRPFHAILCRNVLIYFDRPTQNRLISRFERQLVPGGYLYIGHSESLSGLQHGLEYVAPTVYRRPL